MPSCWNDDDAREHVRRHAACGEALALRIYSSRLLGCDPSLVLHGGGNTSVKTTAVDLFGRRIEVMHVKGSGAALAEVGPEGMPAVRLAPLRELRALDQLDDRRMIDAVRSALLDSRSPMPSVETLLHAFLPHAFVDHTHADAILVLTNQPDPAAHVHAALGADVVVLPWIMPGFPLAKAVAAAYEQSPDCSGIVLAKHGLFTFGDSARQSYERTIDLVDRARRYADQQIGGRPAMLCGEPAPLPLAERRRILVQALPALRGACAAAGEDRFGPSLRRVVAVARTDDDLAAFAAHGSARALCAANPITPDHVLRTRPRYLFLTVDEAVSPDRCRLEAAAWSTAYRRYIDSHAPDLAPGRMPTPLPVVAVIGGVGLVALDPAPAAAQAAADIAAHTLRVKAAAHALGDYVPLGDAELAAMEFWELEQAKLGQQATPLLHGHVALVTGAAGAIGKGIVQALLEYGAAVLASDVDATRLAQVEQALAAPPGRLATAVADQTDSAAVNRLFEECVLRFGGVDCVVPNAGIADVATVEQVADDAFARVLEVNTGGTLRMLRAAAAVFRRQGTGGSVVVQASKNVFAPGPAFAAYSASKAAALQLARVAAIEFAELGVRVNVVNADAVFGDDETPSLMWRTIGRERMRSRGLDERGMHEYYRQRSLLKTPVLPRHVGEAVVFFAAMRTPTTGAVLPVDGGLPEAFPR